MNMRTNELSRMGELTEGCRFLLCTPDNALAQTVAATLAPLGVVAHELDLRAGLGRARAMKPVVVFVDFNPDEGGGMQEAVCLAGELKRTLSDVPCVALGDRGDPDRMIAALRAGVSDFVDPRSEAGALHAAVERLLGERRQVAGYTSVAVLGVRVGVGASSLTAHVADLLQKHLAPELDDESAAAGVALVDLGLPAGDALVYLNADGGEFDFAEAVANVHRLDQTLMRTAFAASANGVAVLPLPQDLDRMASVTQANARRVLQAMQEHFAAVLIDLGGFPHADMVGEVVRRAQQTWIVTDQSVVALVSLARTLAALHQRGIPRERLRLVVNRYDPRYGMSGRQIAERFELTLLAEIPDRTLALMNGLGQGRLLHHVAEHDAYIRAVQHLMAATWPRYGGGCGQSWFDRWLAGRRSRGTS